MSARPRTGWFLRDRDGWDPRLYELWFTRNPMQAAIRRREQDAVWRALRGRVRETDRVLEVGAGTGVYTRSLAGRTRQLIAVDASPAMLGHLRGELAGRPGVTVRAGRLPDEMPVLEGCDGALAVGVLNYVPDLAAGLAALARPLRPGGWIVVTLPLRSPGGAMYQAGEALTRRRVWLHSPEAARAAARRAGIEPEEAWPVGLSRRGFVLLLAGRRSA